MVCNFIAGNIPICDQGEIGIIQRGIISGFQTVRQGEWPESKYYIRHFDWASIGILATLQDSIHSINRVGLDRVVGSENQKLRDIGLLAKISVL